MAAAIAAARDAGGAPRFDVIGVERDNEQGSARAAAMARGDFPFTSPDRLLNETIRIAHAEGNLGATTDPSAYKLANVVVVDVNLDVVEGETGTHANMAGFEAAIRILGERLSAGALVMVETTVPPGTCENIVKPILRRACIDRGLPEDGFLLAHSFERVMPGPGYLDSVINFWRVYAGSDEKAADVCEAFLRKVINIGDYPLRRLNSMTASETAKVLENSYRAANIAFIEEWSRFAEASGIDLFEVIEAVRDRPTHNNIRQPGFGVGGYCLTKDPLFPMAASSAFLKDHALSFPFSELSVAVNRRMPIVNLDRIENFLGGKLRGKRLMLMGVAYRSEVDDTRNAPAEAFYREARTRGAVLLCHDPFVRHWEELELDVAATPPDPIDVDAVVFAVPHRAYRKMDVASWLRDVRPLIYDCDNVLSGETRSRLRAIGCRVESTGRGDGM